MGVAEPEKVVQDLTGAGMNGRRHCCGISIFVFIALLLVIFVYQMHPALAAQEDKEVIAGIPANYPPQYQVDAKTGKPYGFAIDVMDEVARRSGIKVRSVVYRNFSDVMVAMQKGEIDLIPNVGITDERKNYTDFTAPVETFHIHIFVRSTTNGIKNIDDLTGLKVAVVAENQGYFIMKERGGSEMLVYNSMEEALMALISGNADAMVYPEEPLLRVARQSGIEDRIKPVGDRLAEIKRAIGVRKGQPELFNKLDEAVKAFILTPEYEKIYSKWYGKPEPYWNTQRVLIAVGITIALAAAIFFVIHYFSVLRLNKKLRESENKYRKLHESMMDASVTVDMQGRIREFNRAYIEMLGYTEAELRNLNYVDLTPAKWHEFEAKIVEEHIIPKGYSGVYEKEYRRKDGTVFPVELRTFLIRDEAGNPSTMWAIVRDVIERRRAEEALIEQSRIFEAFFENTVTQLVFLDKNFNFIRVNKAYAKSCQRDISEFPGHSHFEFYPSDAKAIFERVVETKEPFQTIEKPFIFPDHPEWGVTYWDWILTPILDNKGEVEYLVFSLNDVTERKRAEEALEKSDARFQLFMRNFPGLAYMKDSDGRVVFANEGFSLYLGLDPAAMPGKTNYDLFPAEFAEKITRDDRQILESGRNETVEEFFAGRHWVTYKFPIQQPGALPLLGGLTIDITERKRAEEEIKVHARQQAQVTKFGLRALADTDLSTLMNEATNVIAQTLEVEYSKVLELLPDGNALLLRAGVGWKGGYVGHATASAGTESQAGYTLLTDMPVIVEDFNKETRFSAPPLLRDHDVVSGMSVIIRGRDRPFGVLGAHTSRLRIFTGDDTNFLQAIANVLAEAIERKRAEEELRKLNAELEQRVKERTTELEEKNAELARMNKLFVGRELRMIELKEQMAKLEKERGKK